MFSPPAKQRRPGPENPELAIPREQWPEIVRRVQEGAAIRLRRNRMVSGRLLGPPKSGGSARLVANARQRLVALILRAATPPARRRATRPSAASRQRRLAEKAQRGRLKEQRGTVREC